jgi:NitT/TauT family transport system ATP-binding protein
LDLWQAEPRSVIFVTHDLNEAIETADKILFLSESPSSVIDEIHVDTPRAERTTEMISAFKDQLKNAHQHLAHLI